MQVVITFYVLGTQSHSGVWRSSMNLGSHTDTSHVPTKEWYEDEWLNVEVKMGVQK